MAYPYEFYKLTFGGGVYDGQDEWSCGLNFGFPSRAVGFEGGDMTAAMSAIAAAIAAYFNDAQVAISHKATLEWVKLAGVGKDGLYFRDPVVHDYETPILGKAIAHPAPQLSLALTFRSSKMRAPGRDARIFLPLPGTSASTDGKLPMAIVTSISVKTAQLIEDIELGLELLEDDRPQLIVASQKTESNNVVKTVRVGRMLDTQRRRRNKFTEDYSPSNIIIRT